MRKHYIRCLAVLSMIVGVFQFGVAESFAEASTATVTTEYALYDTLSPTEQKNLVTKQPEATITQDEENFRLIYQKKTAQPVNQANKTTGATLQQTNTHQVLQSTYKTLPKTGEQKQNKTIVYCGIIFLATGILLLVWKRRQAKKALLVLALIGGTGFTSIAAAATPELPAAKTETLAKGSTFKPDTSVSEYDYLGYIHSSNNHDSPVVPEKKEGTVLVHFVDENGNTIVPAETLTGNIGEKYTSEAKTITGYSLKEVQGNATGTFTDQPQKVTYVYEKEKQLGRVIIDFSKVTSNIGRDFYVYIDEEGVPKWTSVKAVGFVLYDTNYRIPDNGKLELEGEVGNKVVGPSGLNLEVSGYLQLGIVYLDSEGVEQVAEMQGFRISFNEEAPLTYTEENQTIVYNMYYPN